MKDPSGNTKPSSYFNQARPELVALLPGGGLGRLFDVGCGFAAVTSDSADLAHITEGIGERWEVLNNAYKPIRAGSYCSR